MKILGVTILVGASLAIGEVLRSNKLGLTPLEKKIVEAAIKNLC